MLLALVTVAQIPHKYYVGKAEVDSMFWNSIPDSIRKQSAYGMWDNDTVITESLSLPMEYYIDSVNGKHVIKQRDEETVAKMREQLAKRIQISAQSTYRLNPGDIAPNFSVTNYSDGAKIENVLKPGNCYLINFWATWCGNCLLELLPPELPKLAESFTNDKNFVFLPICIDSSLDDLKSFFNSKRGNRWIHLQSATTLDTDRKANGLFAEPGHLPLTIVVNKEGKIAYINLGRISTREQFQELETAIKDSL